MHMDFQIIKTSHSFLIVIIISLQLPAIYWSLAPWSLKKWFLIAPQSLLGLLKLCCRNYSLLQRFQTWALFQIYNFLLPFPLHWMNLQKYFSLKIHLVDLANPTHQKFYLLFWVQRYLIFHIPSHKGKNLFMCFWQKKVYLWILLDKRRKYM